ncbi:hypothetical protein GALMADRAFT_606416 [Galerina marginata CBS 339.88]|uniref:Uncharacterized protein n=1 Tax=Galerina marginata (strain CBS 339.88) TaxID=685588 RepID=A0A067T2J4_GALM3|nr:hypothetical protein GALMADRAFT_606416 [Galerina marginata CBS 339.88]
MPSSKRAPKLKDQFHHVIPRFILREFKMGPKKTKQEREKEFQKSGFVDDKVWFYDIKLGTLEPRLISQVFGVKNLYRDIRNTKDVDEIEKKFSALEASVAHILHNLHNVVQDCSESSTIMNTTLPVFSIIREDLERLRKFLFLMHYRNEAHAKSYFSASHPENADIRERIVKMNKKLGLNINSPAEMWLHFMRYYLDTPHSEIGLHAFRGKESAALSGADALKGSFTVNPDAENFEAMTYHTQASMYFLGIVQAAPGQEFVLGHNTFGLWEGIVAGESGLHRLFVISPQVAMILRLNFFRPDALNTPRSWFLHTLTNSNLLDITLEPPESRAQRDFPRDEARVIDFQKYKTSMQAKRDQFNFRITRLTEEQTYAMNAIVLLNARDSDGSITFASPDRMSSTFQKFWYDTDVNHRRERHKYAALIQSLSSMSGPGPSQSSGCSGTADVFYNSIAGQVLRLGATEPCPAELHYRNVYE